MNQETAKTRNLASITVTYNPDLSILTTQLHALPSECLKIVVDNASDITCTTEISRLKADIPNLHLLFNEKNLGLGAALNQGVRAASGINPEIDFVLLLDQDSEPQAGSIEELMRAFESLSADGNKTGAVGPLLRDNKTELAYGFHQGANLRWRRIYPAKGTKAPIPCTNLHGSGTLMSLAVFQKLGGLDEKIFIDHGDTEWSFRLLANGFSLWGIPQAVFLHRMGESSLRFWFMGWRIWPLRTPNRHYFLFRNAIWLIRRSYVSAIWKTYTIPKLILTIGVHALFDPQRIEQLKQMFRGIYDGIKDSDGAKISTHHE